MDKLKLDISDTTREAIYRAAAKNQEGIDKAAKTLSELGQRMSIGGITSQELINAFQLEAKVNPQNLQQALASFNKQQQANFDEKRWREDPLQLKDKLIDTPIWLIKSGLAWWCGAIASVLLDWEDKLS